MTFLSITENPETVERHMDRVDRAELNSCEDQAQRHREETALRPLLRKGWRAIIYAELM